MNKDQFPTIRKNIKACFIQPYPWMCFWGMLNSSVWEKKYRENVINDIRKFKSNFLTQGKTQEAEYLDQALGFFEGRYGEGLKL